MTAYGGTTVPASTSVLSVRAASQIEHVTGRKSWYRESVSTGFKSPISSSARSSLLASTTPRPVRVDTCVAFVTWPDARAAATVSVFSRPRNPAENRSTGSVEVDVRRPTHTLQRAVHFRKQEADSDQ